MNIETNRLELIARTRDQVLVDVEAMPPEMKVQLSSDWLRQLKESAIHDPWIHGFSVISKLSGIAVGQCGFKGPPSNEGLVEIAYAIEEVHRGKGYATEAASALVSFAFNDARVKRVCAHTLPEANASTRILTKCGFQFRGSAMDPDDGLVWRWEKSRLPDDS